MPHLRNSAQYVLFQQGLFLMKAVDFAKIKKESLSVKAVAHGIM